MAADDRRFDDELGLTEALREDMARRRREGEPPTPEELTAYRDGRLSGEERRRVEEKIAAHPDAARTVLDLASFPEVEPAPGVRTVTSEEVADDWCSLRRKMARERSGAGADVAVPESRRAAVPSAPPPSIARVWGRAAALLLALGLGVLAGLLMQPAAPVGEPDAATGLTVLVPRDAASVRGTAGPAIEADRGQILILDAAGVDAYPAYDLVLRDAAGERRWSTEGTRPNAQGLVSVTLPESYLPPGAYRVELHRPGGAAPPLAVYAFQVVPEGPES